MNARKGLMVLLFGFVCCNVCVGNVHAAWSSDPSVNNVICSEPNNQDSAQITSDGSGGAIITWSDNRSGNSDIYAQRIDAGGAPQWTAGGVAISTAVQDQYSPQITSDGSGGAIITWGDSRSGNSDIYAQRIDAGGVPQWTAGGVALCTEANNQLAPKIISDGSGGAIIAWEDRRSGNYDVYAQRVDAGGAPQWTAGGVAICTYANDQASPEITSDGSGGAIITWGDSRSGNSDIYAQRVNAGGAPQWTAGGVALCTEVNNQLAPKIISDGSGGAIITWGDSRSGNSDIYAQRIDAGGAPQWTAGGVAISTAANNQFAPEITSDGSGGAIITWSDSRSGNSDIYAQRVNAGGAPQWTAGGVAICKEASAQYYSQIISDRSGGAIITWQDFRSGSNSDIYAQRVNAGGAPQWTTDGVGISTAANVQNDPQITSGGSGAAIITWYDERNGNRDIFAQRIDASGTLTVVEMAAAPDIQANGQDGLITVSSGTIISITVSLAPGTETGKPADWWIAVSTPVGIYSLNLAGWTWLPGINLFLQYPLVGVPSVGIYNGLLPAGEYVFYFGVDINPNGALDFPLYYDFVQVHVIN